MPTHLPYNLYRSSSIEGSFRSNLLGVGADTSLAEDAYDWSGVLPVFFFFCATFFLTVPRGLSGKKKKHLSTRNHKDIKENLFLK